MGDESNFSKTLLQKKWSDVYPITTCRSCQAYMIYKSHCRLCGDVYCTDHINCLDEKLVPFILNTDYCIDIPEGKKEQKKLCKACHNMIKQRRYTVLWAKLLMRWLQEFNLNHTLWMTIKKETKIPSLKMAASFLLVAFSRISSPVHFMFASRNYQISNLELQISAMYPKVLFYDVCYRTEKFKNSAALKRINVQAPLWLLVSACQLGYNTHVYTAILRHHKSQFMALSDVVPEEYNNKMKRHIGVLENALKYPKMLHDTYFESSSGLVHVALLNAKQMYYSWIESCHHIMKLINSFKRDSNLNESSCLYLTNAQILYNHKPMDIKGVQIINDKSCRITTSSSQFKVYNVVDEYLLKACLFLNKNFKRHYINFTRLESNAVVFLIKNHKHITNTCFTENSNQINTARFTTESLINIAQILIAYSFLNNTQINLDDCCFEVDDENNLILLNIEQIEKTEQTEVTRETQDLSSIINQRAVQNLRSFEKRYYLIRILGATHQQALSFVHVDLTKHLSPIFSSKVEQDGTLES